MDKYQEASDKISNDYNSDLLTNEWVKKSEIMRQDLKLFKELKQVWNKEEWCQGVPLSADSLKSLFNYNEELFNKNLELDKKVIELEKENQELKELLESSKQGLNYLREVNEELNYSIDSEIYFLTDELFEQKERNIDLYTRYEKLKKVINFLKHNFNIKLDSKLRISDGLECVQTFLFDKETNEVVYDDVKEVLGE